MRNLFKRLPSFSADYSGVCNAVQKMKCLIILHGQGGCIGGVSTCDDYEKKYNEERILFSKISEIDTVTGNDQKLIQQIAADSEEIACDFIVLCGSPIPMLIGTDWNAWVKELEQIVKKPVIAVNTKGFATYEQGEKMIFLELVKKFSVSGEKEKRVNIIGDTCLSGWTEDKRRSLKEKLYEEYDKVISWNDDADILELKQMANAGLNIAASVSALPAVRELEKRYGIPYTTAFPETWEFCGKWEKTDSLLLIGEQVIMNHYRSQLRALGHQGEITVANFFEVDPELMEAQDQCFSGEDDYEEYIERHDLFSYIAGDPLLEIFGGYEKEFIRMKQIALSGRLLNDRW